MKSSIKGILIGSVTNTILGIVAYTASAVWLSTSHGITDSSELVNVMRSNQSMYYSIPYTFLCVLFSCWLATRRLATNSLTVIAAITVVTCITITAGPIKVISIHMNYLPIFIGGLCAIYLNKKLNKFSLPRPGKSPGAGLANARRS